MKPLPVTIALSPLAQRLDALLPQTQCGRCGHLDGCAPYAAAMAAGEAGNRCPPGGQAGADRLAEALGRRRLALDPACGEPDAVPVTARVIEALCIGCGICLDACPVDAIVGAAGVMHVVDIDTCTGCRLCLAPCPMDCIEMVKKPAGMAAEGSFARADAARARFVRHRSRSLRRAAEKTAKDLQRRLSRDAVVGAPRPTDPRSAAIPPPSSRTPLAEPGPDDPVARALARLRALPDARPPRPTP